MIWCWYHLEARRQSFSALLKVAGSPNFKLLVGFYKEEDIEGGTVVFGRNMK